MGVIPGQPSNKRIILYELTLIKLWYNYLRSSHLAFAVEVVLLPDVSGLLTFSFEDEDGLWILLRNPTHVLVVLIPPAGIGERIKSQFFCHQLPCVLGLVVLLLGYVFQCYFLEFAGSWNCSQLFRI